MDDREFGFYARCLNHSWINAGLPVDPAEIMRVMGRPKSYIKQVWPRVAICFELSPDGSRLVNARQEKERIKQAEWREKSREGGRHSAATKRQPNVNGGARVVGKWLQPNGNIASASAFASAKDTPPTPSEADEAFARIWERHPKKDYRQKAETEFGLIVGQAEDPEATAAAIERIHRAKSETEDWRKQNGQFAPQLGNWLRDGGYLDPAPEATLSRPPETYRPPLAPGEDGEALRRENAEFFANLQAKTAGANNL